MQGYFVVTTPPDELSPDDTSFLSTLTERGFLNLHSMRSFNFFTNEDYSERARSAKRKIKRSSEEQRRKNKEYSMRQDVKERQSAYYNSPEVKQRRKERDALRKEMLKRIPLEAKQKALSEARRMLGQDQEQNINQDEVTQ